MFNELKAGDRFYYENNFNPTAHFTKNQINELRRTTIAKIICDNLDVTEIQLNPFSIPDHITNSMISCSNFPGFNYNLFAF